jgi:hypothetical protein
MATQLAPVAEQPLDTGQDTDEQQSSGERDFEAEARAQGWTDADTFKGDKARWVDAETFVKRSDEVMPLLKKQLSHYRAELDQMKREIKRVRKSEQASYDNAYADLKAKMENAVVTGNVAAFKELDAKADQLRKDMADDTPPPADQQKEAVRAFADWRDENEWYDLGGLAGATDMERRQRAYFDRMVEANEDKARTMAPADFIAHIGSLVEAKYPPERAARPKANESVAGVTRTAATRNVHSGANLPADAKETAERYIRQGIPGYKGKTKAEAYELFAKHYDWS